MRSVLNRLLCIFTLSMCTPWSPQDKNFLIYSNLTQKESNHNIHNIFPFEKTSRFYLLHQSYSLNTVLFFNQATEMIYCSKLVHKVNFSLWTAVDLLILIHGTEKLKPW